MSLSNEKGFPTWLAMGKCFRGWALMNLGQQKEGILELHRGLEDWRAIGTELFVPYLLSLPAQGYGRLKRVDEASNGLKEGWAVAERTGEQWWRAERYRLEGELLLHQSVLDEVQAENYFQQALEMARNQQAKSLEIRAATSIARLWQSQDKGEAAYELLAPVYNWFTEGLNNADLREAEILLKELQK